MQAVLEGFADFTPRDISADILDGLVVTRRVLDKDALGIVFPPGTDELRGLVDSILEDLETEGWLLDRARRHGLKLPADTLSRGGVSAPRVPTPSLLERIREGKAIAPADLSANCDDLWTARNWVYARHGYAFSTEKAKSWFGGQQGYQRDESVTSKTIGTRLTATDVANRDLLVLQEKASGCR